MSICLVFKAFPVASSGLSLRPSLGKVLFGEGAPLEDDSESRSEGSSPAFSGSVSPLLLSTDPLHLSGSCSSGAAVKPACSDAGYLRLLS